MFIKANFETVVTSQQLRSKNIIGGSASVRLAQDIGLVKKINNENIITPNKGKIKCRVINNFDDHYIDEILHLSKSDFKELFNKKFVVKVDVLYKLNKNKVRSKILAYANLKQSKRFMAFYSISFPKSLSDEFIRQIHNTALTRIRKYRKNFSYIWVAERQKNGTLHFHMLTNQWLNIRVVNHIYAKAIQNVIKINNIENVKFEIKKYNGVDVKLVDSIQRLTKYLTKYLTKNNELFNGLCWNSDSSVSSLVTTLYLNDTEYKTIYNKLTLWQSFSKEISYFKEPLEFDIYIYGSHKPKLIFETLQEINNYIISTWHKH